jgi:hypothetical protein
MRTPLDLPPSHTCSTQSVSPQRAPTYVALQAQAQQQQTTAWQQGGAAHAFCSISAAFSCHSASLPRSVLTCALGTCSAHTQNARPRTAPDKHAQCEKHASAAKTGRLSPASQPTRPGSCARRARPRARAWCRRAPPGRPQGPLCLPAAPQECRPPDMTAAALRICKDRGLCSVHAMRTK